MPSPSPRIPEALITSILSGNCVAFVGAGFSAPAVPTWADLLRELCDDERLRGAAAILADSHDPSRFEMVGDLVRRVLGQTVMEQRIARIFERRQDDASVSERVRLLTRIPFQAILTTNFDRFIQAGADAEATLWQRILRDDQPWWQRGEWDRTAVPRSRVVKLHGEANGDPARLPVVLARTEYRERVYGDPHYANRLKALLTTRTFLFLGTSFTDAYLNELRSSVLASLGPGSGPVGFAFLNRRLPEERAWFRDSERIELVEYDLVNGSHAGFDELLIELANRTSVGGRIAHLRPSARIAWVDAQPSNNDSGVAALERSGIHIERLARGGELSEQKHGDFDLIITRWGHRPDESEAVKLLKHLSTWSKGRPPVVVFADGAFARQNRAVALRHGAYDFCSTWQGLFRVVERAFSSPDVTET